VPGLTSASTRSIPAWRATARRLAPVAGEEHRLDPHGAELRTASALVSLTDLDGENSAAGHPRPRERQ
jgi:hypothetical protein